MGRRETQYTWNLCLVDENENATFFKPYIHICDYFYLTLEFTYL